MRLGSAPGRSRRLVLSVLVLALSLAGLGTAQEEFSAVFVTRQVEHASVPLLTVSLVSDVACGLLCLATADCVKWQRDAASGQCRLLPLHSAASPLTAAAGPVRQRPHPAGYVVMPAGGGVTYRPHTRLTSAGQVLIQLCREDDPQAVPAFITTDQQFDFLMSLPLPYDYQWLSINDFQEEGVYKDLFNETTVDIENWISPSFSYFDNELYDGVLLGKNYGLMNRRFTDQHSYLCEYWM